MRTLGCDVSHWEPNINWHEAAKTIMWSYYKCTDGTTWVDDTFTYNKTNTRAAGIVSAPYHWFQPNQPGLVQAEHFINTAGKDYKVYVIDVEQQANPAMTQGAYWRNLTIMIKRVIELTAKKVAIYTGCYKWIELVGYQPYAVNYDLFLARYSYAKNPATPYPWNQSKRCKVWQFTDYGFIRGYPGNIDLNWFFGNETETIEYFGA